MPETRWRVQLARLRWTRPWLSGLECQFIAIVLKLVIDSAIPGRVGLICSQSILRALPKEIAVAIGNMCALAADDAGIHASRQPCGDFLMQPMRQVGLTRVRRSAGCVPLLRRDPHIGRSAVPR